MEMKVLTVSMVSTWADLASLRLVSLDWKEVVESGFVDWLRRQPIGVPLAPFQATELEMGLLFNKMEGRRHGFEMESCERD
jgi:hypothetical protein